MPQENNMAEVIRLLHTVIGKVDGLATGLQNVEAGLERVEADVDVLKTNVRNLETKVDRVEGKVDLLGGQFQDVVRVVIENTQRIEGLEGRVDILESKAN